MARAKVDEDENGRDGLFYGADCWKRNSWRKSAQSTNVHKNNAERRSNSVCVACGEVTDVWWEPLWDWRGNRSVSYRPTPGTKHQLQHQRTVLATRLQLPPNPRFSPQTAFSLAEFTSRQSRYLHTIVQLHRFGEICFVVPPFSKFAKYKLMIPPPPKVASLQSF